MPFKSKAQQRFMFAQHPRMAKNWAGKTEDIKGLPEKLHPEENVPKSKYKKGKKMTKKAATGMFFKEASSSRSGHFFRDLPGRDEADFHQKTAQMGMSGRVIPRGGGMDVSPPGAQMFGTGEGDGNGTSSVSVSPSAPIGGMGQKGEGMGGTASGASMYGAGSGKKGAEEALLKKLLAGASKGTERKAGEKTAALQPSDWSADAGLPTGLHRPTSEQPEALEAGGERFNSSDEEGPDFGAGQGIMHGLVEGGSLKTKKGTGHQLGKHASAGPPRFLGTSYGLSKQAAYKYEPEEYVRRTGEKALGSAKRGLSQAGETADKAIQAAAGSPLAVGLAGLLAARMGMKGIKGVGKGALRLAGRKPKAPPSLVGQVVGSMKKLMS